MNEGLREDAILWEVEPEGAGPFSGGSLTVQPFQIGIVIRDGEVVDVFESGKRNLPRRGEVRTYVASTAPFNLTFWLMDPEDPNEPEEGVALNQPVLTSDGQLVTGRIDLTLRAMRKNVEYLWQLLKPGSGGVTSLGVSRAIEGELLAKVLALDIHRYTAEELRGNRELFRGIYESANIELASTIRRYGLQLDNFYVNWGLTPEERAQIRVQRHEEQLREIQMGREVAAEKRKGVDEDDRREEIGYSSQVGDRFTQDVPRWVQEKIPSLEHRYYTGSSYASGSEESFVLEGKVFLYRISFTPAPHGGANVRIFRAPIEISEGNYSSEEDGLMEEATETRSGQANASYYTPPQFLGHETESPSSTAEVSDFEQESSGPSVTVVAVGVLIASALLVAAFFLAPQIFAGIFVLGLIATISGVFLDKDTVRNIGIVVLAIGIVGMLGAAVLPTG